jgi:hypothetical protein
MSLPRAAAAAAAGASWKGTTCGASCVTTRTGMHRACVGSSQQSSRPAVDLHRHCRASGVDAPKPVQRSTLFICPHAWCMHATAPANTHSPHTLTLTPLCLTAAAPGLRRAVGDPRHNLVLATAYSTVPHQLSPALCVQPRPQDACRDYSTRGSGASLLQRPAAGGAAERGASAARPARRAQHSGRHRGMLAGRVQRACGCGGTRAPRWAALAGGRAAEAAAGAAGGHHTGQRVAVPGRAARCVCAGVQGAGVLLPEGVHDCTCVPLVPQRLPAAAGSCRNRCSSSPAAPDS